MNVTIPPDLDILYFRTSTESTISIVLEDEQFGPVPSKGAFVALLPRLMKSRPDVFPTKAAGETVLTLLHFQFMTKGQNRAGIDYPFTASP